MNTAAALPTPTTVPKFHFSLWVADLSRTIAFYRVLFGQEPHKEYSDYAKFEVAEPPLVLSFLPQPAPRGASLNHVGLRLPDSAGLVEVQRRLEQAGYPTIREDGVECCYALQTKFWVTDPDGVKWEIYAVHRNVERYGRTRSPVAPEPAAEPVGELAGRAWTHTLPDTVPERVAHDDGALDEVTLLNTFNASDGPTVFAHALSEAKRVLCPGGRLTVRGLVGDRPYPGTPDFPGLSAKYRHVPVPAEPLAALVASGFHNIEVETWKDVSCVGDSTGVRFRVVVLTAQKGPAEAPLSPTISARYVGPFASLTDDDGTTFPVGVPVPVSAARAALLRQGPAGAAFVFTPRS